MIGIYKSVRFRGIYFVLDPFMGIQFLFEGSLADCRSYCRERGHPTRVMGSY